MKATRVSNNQVLITFDSAAEMDAARRARSDIRKSSLADDLGVSRDSALVRRVNAILMLTGRVLDSNRDTSTVSQETFTL